VIARQLALLGLLVVACSTQQSATPSPAPCKLAVIDGSPGFLTVPGGQFTAAPDAGDGIYYDKSLRKWVPVGPPALSADGLESVYIDGDTKTSKVHLVDLRSGNDRVVASGGPWQVAGLSPDAVYVMRVEYVETNAYGRLAIGQGLWQVPLDGSAPVQLTSDARAWLWFADGAVYGGGSTADVAGGPNDIVRFDVQTMRQTTLFSRGVRSRLLAVDATGVALIMGEATDRKLWLVSAAGDAVPVWSGGMDAPAPDYPFAVDGSDVWLSGAAPAHLWAIYHSSRAGGFQLVATFNDHPVTVAGPCA